MKEIRGDSRPVEITIGDEADSLLNDEAFTHKWNELHASCPWATPFQSLAFVKTWYEVYRPQFHPLLVCDSSPSGELIGLFALALSLDTERLVVAGSRQAEYHVWLARPEYGESFIKNALLALRARFPRMGLVLRYLPPLAPAGWAGNGGLRGVPLFIEPFRRPLMIVGDGSESAASLKKSSNKSRMNRLKRIGEVRLEQIRDESDLNSVLDEIGTYYDLRQGAANGVFHFRNDPFKKAFHLALMRQGVLLDVTVLRAGDKIVSAHLGLCGADTVYLGIIAHNPFYSKYSPGKLHILLMGQSVAARGLSTIDLTPGAESWKDRFANRSERVLKLTVFSSKREQARFVAEHKAKSLARSLLKSAGVSPQLPRNLLRKLRRLSVSRLTCRLRQALWKDYEYRMYYLRPSDIDKLENRRQMARDKLEDLLCYDPAESWQTLEHFLSQSLKRLAEGCHVYTFVENGRLLHYCWMKERQAWTFFTEVGQEFHFPPGSASLFDAYTHPEGRGKGLYQSCLSQMAHDAADVEGTRRVYGYVMSDNRPSRHVIEKLGFIYDRSFFMRVRLGRTFRWRSK